MSLYHDPHDLIIQLPELEELIAEVFAPKSGGFGW
jgi:hypothetical protein